MEVRTPQGVKAKWITIELRKVETLTGGGVANTFYDSVPGPIKLWEASQDSDYELLRSVRITNGSCFYSHNRQVRVLQKDFAFTIRIPESIPPTLNLDDRGGELASTINFDCKLSALPCSWYQVRVGWQHMRQRLKVRTFVTLVGKRR